jgi:flagellar motility protein MotE (MotC chaperone)
MIARLQNPILVSAIAVLAGVVAGIVPLWRAAESLTAAIIAAAPPAASVAPEKDKGWDFWTVEMDNLASELKDEKAKLKQQAEQLELRAARLASEQQELAKVRTELEGMRREIDERTVQIGTDELKNLRTLSQTYANLTPKAAVVIISEMDDTTVVKIVSLMKPDIVAPIFEEMSHASGADGAKLARRAAVLSEKIRLLRAMKTATTN